MAALRLICSTRKEGPDLQSANFKDDSSESV